MSEAREQQWRRQRRMIQDAVLHEYPNPERVGCPPDEVLIDMAERSVRLEILFEHNQWHHVTHCSPCYEVFLTTTQKLRGERLPDRLIDSN